MSLSHSGDMRRRIRISLFLLVFASFVHSANAQSALEGVVSDTETGVPIPGVHVYLETARAGTITGLDGTFSLVLTDSPDVLVARFVGYETARVAVTSSTASPLRVELSPGDIQLDDVVVSATRERQFISEIAASVGSVSADAIRDANPSHPADIMGQVAGVWVNNTSGEGHMTAIRQPLSTDPLYLYLENGVPTRSTGFFNHNALYEINIPQSESIEIVKGPGTALYGSDAIGGVINVTSAAAPAVPTAEVLAEGGSYGYKRALVSLGTTAGLNGIRLDVNATDSEGWRDATQYQRQSATLRWDRRSRSNWMLRTVASWSNVDQEPAGSAALSESDYRADATQNFQPVSFRRVQALRVSSAFEKWYPRTLVSVTPYARFNTMDLLPNWSLTFDPAIWETQNWSVGALVKVRRDLDRFNSRIVAGLDLDMSPGERIETKIAPDRVDGAFVSYTELGALYDYDVTYRQASPYLHFEGSPVPSVRVTAGLRFDVMAYDYTNNLTVETAGRHRRPADTNRSFTHLSPKLGMTWQVSPAVNVFTSWRHAFRAPSENQLFRQGSSSNTIDLDPVRVDNVELGLRGRVPQLGTYEATGYVLIKRDDILDLVLPDGTIVGSNAGQTQHRGIELGLATVPIGDLSFRVGGSYAEHTYEEWDVNASTSYTGNEMEVAPRVLLNAAATYNAPVLNGASLTLEWSRLGSYWMDPANTSKYEGHDVLNLNLNVRITNDVTLLTRVSNLTDRLYAERATYNAFRGDEFAPGSPRSVHVSLRYRVQ